VTCPGAPVGRYIVGVSEEKAFSGSTGPRDWFVTAVVLGVIGSIPLSVGLDQDSEWQTILGFVLTGLAALCLTVAVIAKGVAVGIRASRDA
jgi:protein-S-isoprenylcysteine O-methyltransferase Ste14